MELRQSQSRHSLASFIMLLAIVNLLVLDLLIVRTFLVKQDKQVTKTGAVSISKTPDTNTNSDQIEDQDCSPSCQAAIDKAVSSIKLTPQVTVVQTKTQIIVQPTTAKQNENTVKEFFVPLGSGSSTATDWTDIPGAKAEVNSNNYGGINQVLFETSVRVPNTNQIVDIRLYNETDKLVVSNSEMSYPSGTNTIFRITSIQLSSGSKTYKVQMKTQLGYTTLLDQARIHITTN